MDNELKESLSRSETWIRGLYMLLFYIILSVTRLVLAVVVIFQFLMKLITSKTNDRLLDFGDDLSVFTYQILQFLTFNTEDMPFPFSPWPLGADGVVADDYASVEMTEPAAPAAPENVAPDAAAQTDADATANADDVKPAS